MRRTISKILYIQLQRVLYRASTATELGRQLPDQLTFNHNKSKESPAHLPNNSLLFSSISRGLETSQVFSTSPPQSAEPPAEKACNKCGEVKPKEAYTRHSRSRDGLQHFCKECAAKEKGVAPIPQPSVSHKACSRCMLVKPAGAFNRARNSLSGLQAYCRDCSVSCAQVWQRLNTQHNVQLGRPGVDQQECSACMVVKPAVDFDKDLACRSGLYHLCKECRSLSRRHRYKTLVFQTPPREKSCMRCNKTKSSEEFYKSKAMSDGVLSVCKACVIAQVKAYNAEKRSRGPPHSSRVSYS